MHIISESVLMPFTQNQSMLVETTACQICLVFLIHSVDATQHASAPVSER